MGSVNYFSYSTAAERYLKGRPDFHNNTIQHIKEFLKLEDKLGVALDVACGTGLSAKALLEIASHVYGTDSSQAMLDVAIGKDKINYQIASAEEQPFANSTFDLITVCSGVHWFDIDRFLLEANRLLKSLSWLVLYDNFIPDDIEGDKEFENWYKEIYLDKFPAPIRNDKYSWTSENPAIKMFDFAREEKFMTAVSFTKNELTRYITTQSNIIAAVENKVTSYDEVEDWLEAEISKFFVGKNNNRVIHFGNWIKYLQKK